MPRIHALDSSENGLKFDSYHARSAIFAALLAKGAAASAERAADRRGFLSDSGLTCVPKTVATKSCEIKRTPLRKKGWAIPNNPRRLVSYDDLNTYCW
ncbi:hypothetical protein Bpfe_026510, partial [Biomphalaria pfeifferi]